MLMFNPSIHLLFPLNSPAYIHLLRHLFAPFIDQLNLTQIVQAAGLPGTKYCRREFCHLLFLNLDTRLH